MCEVKYIVYNRHLEQNIRHYDSLLNDVLYTQIIPLFLYSTPDRSAKLFPYLIGLLKSNRLVSILEKYKEKALDEVINKIQTITNAILPKGDETKEIKLFNLSTNTYLQLIKQLTNHIYQFFLETSEIQSLLNGLLSSIDRDGKHKFSIRNWKLRNNRY